MLAKEVRMYNFGGLFGSSATNPIAKRSVRPSTKVRLSLFALFSLCDFNDFEYDEVTWGVFFGRSYSYK